MDTRYCCRLRDIVALTLTLYQSEFRNRILPVGRVNNALQLMASNPNSIPICVAHGQPRADKFKRKAQPSSHGFGAAVSQQSTWTHKKQTHHYLFTERSHGVWSSGSGGGRGRRRLLPFGRRHAAGQFRPQLGDAQDVHAGVCRTGGASLQGDGTTASFVFADDAAASASEPAFAGAAASAAASSGATSWAVDVNLTRCAREAAGS